MTNCFDINKNFIEFENLTFKERLCEKIKNVLLSKRKRFFKRDNRVINLDEYLFLNYSNLFLLVKQIETILIEDIEEIEDATIIGKKDDYMDTVIIDISVVVDKEQIDFKNILKI